MFFKKRNIQINKNFNSLSITIPFRVEKFEFIIIIVGICMATFLSLKLFKVAFSYSFHDFHDLPHIAYKIIIPIFVIFFTYGILKTLMILLFSLYSIFYGKTIINLNSHNLEIKTKLFKKEKIEKFDLEKIKNIYYEFPKGIENTEKVNKIEIETKNKGCLVLLYEETFEEIASNLSKIEAKKILTTMIHSKYIESKIFKPYNILDD